MESKRGLPKHLDLAPDAKRFRLNAADMLFKNQVSARRMQTLLLDAAKAGADHVDDLAAAKPGAHGNRDLKRKLLKGSKWPKPYKGKVRTWNPKTQKSVE